MTVLFAVKVAPDLVVWRTPEDWARLTSGVTVQAAWSDGSPLKPETEEEQ